MYKQSKKNNNGFTLVELLVVIGCISILTAVAVPSYALMQKNIGLSNAAQEVVNTLRVAQNNAISAQDGVNWGVHFEQNQYILCKADCSVGNYVTTYTLNNGLQIESAPFNVVFNRLDGTLKDTTVPQTITLDSGGKQKTIQVDAVGRISITN